MRQSSKFTFYPRGDEQLTLTQLLIVFITSWLMLLFWKDSVCYILIEPCFHSGWQENEDISCFWPFPPYFGHLIWKGLPVFIFSVKFQSGVKNFDSINSLFFLEVFFSQIKKSNKVLNINPGEYFRINKLLFLFSKLKFYFTQNRSILNSDFFNLNIIFSMLAEFLLLIVTWNILIVM